MNVSSSADGEDTDWEVQLCIDRQTLVFYAEYRKNEIKDLEDNNMPSNKKTVFKYESVADQILDQIRQGRWKEGDKLPSEGQLMDEFGVSRVTLREALKRLAATEVVEIVQGDGTYVKRFVVSNYMKTFFSLNSISEESIEHIYQARIFVEGGMTGIAAENRSEENLKRLSYLINRMEEEIAFNRYVEYSRYDEKFHKLIYEISGNQLLKMMSDMFQDTIVTYTQRLNQNPIIVERSMMDHRLIYYAIEEKNAVFARMLMERHLEHSKNQLLKIGL